MQLYYRPEAVQAPVSPDVKEAYTDPKDGDVSSGANAPADDSPLENPVHAVPGGQDLPTFRDHDLAEISTKNFAVKPSR